MKLLFCLLLAVLGVTPQLYAQSASHPDPNRIIREEIEASSATNVYELIQALRPIWFARQHGTGGSTSGSILAFQDMTQLGEVEALRGVAVYNVQRVEFLSPAAVQQRLGRYSANGGILIVTASGSQNTRKAAFDWTTRDADDRFSLYISAGWVRSVGSEWFANNFRRGYGLSAGLGIPVQPDVSMRLSYFRYIFDGDSPESSGLVRGHSAVVNGGSVEGKGQLSGLERVVPYAVAGILFEQITTETSEGSKVQVGFGYIVGLGVDVRVVGPLRGFLEVSHTSASVSDQVTAPLQPLRAGVAVVLPR